MLTSLHIENVAVIERADIAFTPGFNVLTGETGAGKSIVIDSIDAVLGGRASREMVRGGADHAAVGAVFTPDGAEDWCRENDVDCGGELILQRRIGADGRSSCRVNGMPVTAQQLRALGGVLLDIHGQNDGRQLLDESRHLEYLDRFADNSVLRAEYSAAYGHYSDIRRETERLTLDAIEKDRLTENLNYQISELEKAGLRQGEEAELTSRRELMKNAEKLTEALDGAYAALYGGDVNAIALSAEAARLAGHASGFAPELAEAAKTVSDAKFMLEDAAERIGDVRASLDFSPEEFDRVESRLLLIRRLERKYAGDEAALLEKLEDCRGRLAEIEYADDRLAKLAKDGEKAAAAVLSTGKKLTESRVAASKTLAERIVAELKFLNMPSVRFVADISPAGGENGFGPTGCDEVRFLMSANAGETPGRIAHIASGGELSRIMLAMKSVFAEKDAVRSLVFDEIDAGISGIAAQRVGEKIGALSRHIQIICVTHLPQIAAMADTHFSICKTETDGRTYTEVAELDRSGRIGEIARLHGGDAVTATTLRSAEEQLEAAERFKAAAQG